MCSWDNPHVCDTVPAVHSHFKRCLVLSTVWNCCISHLADSSAMCQGPVGTTTVFVPLSGRGHNQLGVKPEGNTTLGTAGHLCHVGKQTEQSRAELS